MSALLLTLLAASGGDLGVSRGNFLPKPQYATQSALTLTVTASGSDLNACTVSLPCATVARALSLVPKRVRHPVVVNVGTGSFAGFNIAGFYMDDPADPSVGAYIDVVGTLVNATLASGSVTGTIASATAGSNATWGTATVTGAGWTVNNLRGRLIEITGGTGSGQIQTIDGNTSTVVTITGAWDTTPDNTSTFAVRDWGTSITSAVPRPASINAVQTANYTHVLVNDVITQAERSQVGIERFSMALSVTNGIFATGPTTVFARYNKFANVTNAVMTVVGQNALVQRNSASTVNTLFTASIGLGNASLIKNVVQSGDLIDSLPSGSFTSTTNRVWTPFLAGYNLHSVLNGSITGDKIDGGGSFPGLVTTASSLKGNGGVSVASSDFSNCTTAFDVEGQSYYKLASVTGTGNTTVLSVAAAGVIQLDAATAAGITGTNQIVLDQAGTFTFANLAALSPTSMTDMASAARVVQQ